MDRGTPTIEEFMPYSLMTVPIIWVKSSEPTWIVASMLNRYLGSFTDHVSVMDDGQIIGVVDARDLLSAILKHPTSDFFQNSCTADIMINEKSTITIKMNMLELINRWKTTRRDYAVLKNNKNNLCTLSARTVSEAAILFFDKLESSDIQKNEIIRCSKDNTVGEVIRLMFKNNIRRVFFNDNNSFVCDRAIIKKIVTEFEFLHKDHNLLDTPVSQIETVSPIVTDNKTSFIKLIKIMATKENPCILFANNKIVTPHDIVISVEKFLKQEH